MSATEFHAEGLSPAASHRPGPERTSALHGATPENLSGRQAAMATNLELFTHATFGKLRTIIDGDTIYICAKDAATALGYANTNDAIQRHCDGVVKRYPISDSMGCEQEAVFITEGDLYQLIFSSHLPAAKAFTSWVVNEVLPSIRRHGIYATDRLLDDDDLLEAALIRLRDERLARRQAEQELAEARPKLTYYDQVIAATGAVAISRIAKDYGMSARRLNALLAELGVQYKLSGQWLLYAKHAEQGYAKSETGTTDTGHVWMHTKWTQKGRLFIYDLLKHERGLLPVIERGDAA